MEEFAAPIGAVLVYRGGARWHYTDSATVGVTVLFHNEANSYALDTGGMIGTSWVVVSAIPDALSKWGEFTVTLNPT